MSGQKYKRTNFDDDENTSTAGTPPGVTYDPAIAFKVTNVKVKILFNTFKQLLC